MRVLIIGASGTGKTYMAQRLRKSGVRAVDADDLWKMHVWYDFKGRRVKDHEKSFAKDREKFLNTHSLRWDRAFLAGYLKDKPNLLLFGLSENAFRMRGLFDKTYFLKASAAVIKKRLRHKSRKNAFGKTAKQRKLAVHYARRLERTAEKLKIPFIDAALPPKKILRILGLG